MAHLFTPEDSAIVRQELFWWTKFRKDAPEQPCHLSSRFILHGLPKCKTGWPSPLKLGKVVFTGKVVFNLPYFHSGTEVNLEGTDVNDLYLKMTDKIVEGIKIHNKGGSNFIFKQTLSLEIHTVQYEPLGGSSYIELPESLANKKAIINLKNTDNKCFMWAVTRALHPAKDNSERIDTKLIKATEKFQLGRYYLSC